MSRWFFSKVNTVALHLVLAFRAAQRAVCPVARCKVDGLSIAIRISTPNEHHRADTYATKEPETIEWVRENLRDGDVFYDVGANIGLYSLYAAKLRPACRVFAFEPESHNFGNLCENLLLNRVENVTPCFFALSSHEAFAPFYVYDLRPGGALHSLGRPSPLRDGPPLLTTGAIAVAIDVLVSRHELPAPDLLKLDVDGNEEQILNGATAVLASGSLRSILVEVTWSDEPKPALSWAESKLAPFGYQLKGKSACMEQFKPCQLDSAMQVSATRRLNVKHWQILRHDRGPGRNAVLYRRLLAARRDLSADVCDVITPKKERTWSDWQNRNALTRDSG